MSNASFVRTFMGFAIGDAFGSPFEGFPAEEARRRLKYFEKKGKLPGELTDDTIQMLVLAESLSNTIYFSPQDFAERLRMCYEAGLIRRIGPTSSKALENLRAGLSWRESGVKSNTCGSAMRVMPVGILYSFDLNLVEEYAVLQSLITHRDKEAIASSVATALTYACAFNGDSVEDMRDTVVEAVKAYDAYTTLLVERAFSGEFEYRGTVLASDVVPAAIQCFVYSEDFGDCLRKAVELGGDTDSIAAIAGGLKAACGFEPEVYPEPEVEESELERVKRIAEKLERVYEFIK